MSLVVFTGGARSGKSEAAQRLAVERGMDGSRVVVAVFGRGDQDVEMESRIDRHRSDRPSGFETLEASNATSWTESVPAEVLLVVDCLGSLLGRIVDEELAASGIAELSADAEAVIGERFDEVVGWLARRAGDTIVVTNEVGEGIVPSYRSGRLFRDLLGRGNRMLVGHADRAYLVTCGRLVELSGLEGRAKWPED